MVWIAAAKWGIIVYGYCGGAALPRHGRRGHCKMVLFQRAILLVCMLVVPSAVSAQGSFLDKAQDFLKQQGGSGGAAGLSTSEIDSGLREALRVGTERVVGQLGRLDGFNANPELHIPLPDSLEKVQSALNAVGASGLADDLELRLNRAAEAATPQAKEIFWQAIEDMSLSDVEQIYNGPDDAATQYFQGKMTQPLVDSMRPVVDSAVAEAGAVQAYDSMIGQYQALPFMPDVKADLTDHVLEKSLDGLFLYLGREEAAIRQNPAQRTTDLLKRVFGASG